MTAHHNNLLNLPPYIHSCLSKPCLFGTHHCSISWSPEIITDLCFVTVLYEKKISSLNSSLTGSSTRRCFLLGSATQKQGWAGKSEVRALSLMNLKWCSTCNSHFGLTSSHFLISSKSVSINHTSWFKTYGEAFSFLCTPETLDQHLSFVRS